MKLKKEYLILMLIIVALSIYLATRSMDQTHFALPAPPPVESQAISRLLVAKAGNTIELTKKDDQWHIEPKGYPADNIKVRNMVKAAVDLTITDLISESGNYERYDLTDDKKTNIRIFAGQDLVRDFDIGKSAPTYQHTFARLADDANVYQVRGSLGGTFNHSPDNLRDLTVLTFEKADIAALNIAVGEQSMTLSKKELPPDEKEPAADEAENAEKNESAQEKPPAAPKTQWQAPDGQAVDQSSVERLLNDLSNIKCDKFMADDAAGTLNKPKWSVTFNSAAELRTFSVYEKETEDASEYPATSSATPYAFKISKSKAEGLEKAVNKLLMIETEVKTE